MKKHAMAWMMGLAKYGIGFGLLGYILATNWEPKGESPGISGLLKSTPEFGYFLALALIAVVGVGIQFVRWYVLVRALDIPFTLGDAFRLGLVGAFYNAFLPGSVGGDLVKAYYIARNTPGQRAAAVATVIADRIVGLFGLIWFSAAFGGVYWLMGDERIANNDYLKKIVVICAGLAGATVIGWAILGFLPQTRADIFAGRLTRLPKRILGVVARCARLVLPLRLGERFTHRMENVGTKAGGTLAEMWYAVWTYRQRPRTIYAAVAMTAVSHVGLVFMFHVAVQVFPVVAPASLPEHFVIAPIGYIAQAFFPAPGGLGGGEAIFGYLYTLLGRPNQTGVVGRLTIRVIEWGIGLVGLYFFLRMKAHHELPPEDADLTMAVAPPPNDVESEKAASESPKSASE